MKVYVAVKRLGRRGKGIKQEELILGSRPATLRQLIVQVVTAAVAGYNRRVSAELLQCLAPEQLQERAERGKVSFGSQAQRRPADCREAVACAIQGFEDGLIRVFVGERELRELDEQLVMAENDVLTFIRLTALTGKMW